ncbi:unnamed protein product [Paramecium pentaurelia]|uniref:EGF-like domain-containing protein n=1 Tax=Paramecium pentaurelia TaxID=43138 RepID=A0A8S1V898_9CILI|nr:unnamed protein product [Paramecium pentaurelia]
MNYILIFLLIGFASCQCQEGYIWTNTGCRLCQNFCSSCTNGLCDQCPPSYYGDSTHCYSNHQNKLGCYIGCTQCTDYQVCTSCQSPYYFLVQNLCQRCASPCETCDDQGACLTCISGYMVVGNDCQRCQSPCSQCSGELYKCTSCKQSPPQHYYLSGQSCILCEFPCVSCISKNICTSCNQGYYLNQSQYCIKCTEPCLDCNGPTNCLSCINQEYYIELGDNQCQICSNFDSNCLTCQAYNQCSSCKTGYYVQDDFIGSQFISTCKKCSSQCLTCSNDSNECVSCNNIYQPPTCKQICNSSQFQDGLLCYSCASQCQTCSLKSIQCLSCSINRISPPLCPCKETYFDLNGDCTPCISNCKYCFNAISCIKCQDGLYLQEGICVQQCDQLYYISRDSNCVYCNINNCIECNINGICDQCQQNYLLYKNQCYSQQCNQGQYTIDNENCLNCDASCYNCLNQANNCVECYNGQYLLEINQINNCVVECPLNYYIHNNQCLKCNSNCQQCSQENVCTSCIVGQFLLNNVCYQNCPIYYYGIDQQCILCPNNCETCYDKYCYNCQNGYLFYQNSCLEYCPEGYYGDNNQKCQRCQNICKECVNDHECISCSAPLYFENNTCIGYCPISYYRDLVDNRCKQCIDGCEICENETFCYKCLPNYAAFKKRCVIECDIGYYVEDQYCRQCDFDCYTCYGPTKFDCIVCKYGLKLYKSICIEECPKNTILKNGQCIECHETCDTCFDSGNQNCLTCKLDYILLNNGCYAYCPSQYYKNKGQCLKCQDNCDICINNLSCIRCLNNYYYNGGNCLSVCPNGYYGYDGVCEKCHFSCETCNGALQTNCVTCTQPLVQQNNECLPGCLNRYYKNLSNICQSCKETCAMCTNNDNCSECIYNYYLHPLTKDCVQICDNGYMHNYIQRKCQICATGCQSCFGQSNNQCLSCFPNYFYYKNQCWYSQCPISTYDEQGICIQCDQYCMTCDAQQSCLSCLSGYFYYNQKCYQTCPDGYFGDSINKQCSQCKQNCRICQDADNCTYCYNHYTNNGQQDYFLFDNQCVAICPINYNYFLFECTQNITPIQIIQNVAEYCYDDPNTYLDINQNLCIKCEQSCQTCFGPYRTQCRDCINLSANRMCVDQCGQQTYQSGNECIPCHLSCKYCVSNNRIDNCTHCHLGAYLQLQENQLYGRCVNICDVGYYQDYDNKINGQIICKQCSSNCLTCIYSIQCTSCVEPKVLRNGNCVDSCNSNEFISKIDNKCYQCKAGCSTCIDSLSCTLPFIGYSQTLYLQNNQVYASCGEGYYTSGLLCLECLDGCRICSDSNSCSKCNSSFILFNSNCIPQCTGKSYFDNGQCSPCHINCSFCYNGDENSCISCETGLKYIVIYDNVDSTYKSYCQDTCPQNYTYDIQQRICLYNSCHNSCLTCVGDQYNQCVTCPNNQILSLVTSKYGTCQTTCSVGMYNDNGICLNCNDFCQECTSYSSCTICKSNFYHLNQQLCVIQCPLGYYQNIDTYKCDQCDSNCYECIYPNICINYIQNCATNQFLYQNTCINCHWTCLTCDGPTEYDCTSCGYIHPEYRYSYYRQCLLSCPKSDDAHKCQLCPENCEMCNSNQECISCFIGYYLLFNTCVTSCEQRYYANQQYQICEPCFTGCLECVGPSHQQCVLCEPNYLLSDNQCLPYCPYKYYYNFLSTKCEYCDDFIYKNSCVIECPLQYNPINNVCIQCTNDCNSCQNGLYLYQNTCISNCIIGTYNVNGVCNQCDIQCYSCQSQSDNCQQCSSVTRYNAPFCECQIGYQQDSPNKDCIKCANQCHSCINTFNNCIQCKSDRISNPPACTCPYGKYNNGVNCVPCKHECDDCLSNTLCLYCKGDRVGNNCLCRLGYYDDNSSLYCQKCDHSCTTCTKYGCLECLGNRILNNNNQCLCQQGFYEDGESINCLKCHFKCQTCSINQYNCLICKGDRQQTPYCQCLDGYYDDEVNIDCQSCPKECYTCNKASCLNCKANRFGSICDCPPGGIDRQDVGYMHCETCELGLPIIQMQPDLTTLIIKFGKQVTFNFDLGCSQIIDVSLLGVNPKCSINQLSQIVIQLGINNSIEIGNLIQLFTNIKGIDCDLPYTSIFSTNILPPYIINDSDVMIFGPSQVSTCEVTEFKVSQYFFDGHNGFKMVSWNLESISPYNQLTEQQIFGILYEVNLYKSTVVTIPPNILQQNTIYKFKYQFINYLGQNQIKYYQVQCLPLNLPIISIQNENQQPQVYYINNRIIIKATIQQQSSCDSPILNNVNAFYKIQAFYQNNLIILDKQFNFKHSSQKYVEIFIEPYTFTQSGYYQVFLMATFDQLNIKSKSMTFKMLMPGIYAKIYGGNQIHSYGQSFNITAIVKDLNVKELQTKDIDYSWTCINVALQRPCETVDKQPFTIKNQQIVKIPSRTLAPFNSYQFVMKAQKKNLIQVTSSIMTIVDVEISTFSMDTPNIALNIPILFNQELLFEVSSLQLTNLHGCIIYDFQQLSAFSIPYNTFAISLQNLLKQRYDQIKLQIFSTDSIYFTPLLTSVEITTIQPPLNCKFNVSPKKGLSYDTIFKLEIQSCVDQQNPIYYKFLFYYNQTQYQQDILMNSQMNADLIIDYQEFNIYSTILPKSTNSHSIIIAIIKNQLGAQTNLTSTVIIGQDLAEINDKVIQFESEINSNQAKVLEQNRRILNDDILNTFSNLYNQSKDLNEIQRLSLLNILTIGVEQYTTQSNHLDDIRSILYFDLQSKLDLPLISETTKMQIKKSIKRIIINNTIYLQDFSQIQVYLTNLNQSLSKSIDDVLFIINSISQNQVGYRDYQQKELEKINMIHQLSTLDYLLKSQSNFYYEYFNGNISLLNETMYKSISSNFESILNLLQMLKYGLLLVQQVNDDPITFSGSSFTLIFNRLTTEKMNEYLSEIEFVKLVDKPIDNNTHFSQSLLLNFSYFHYLENPFVLDSSYPNNTHFTTIQSIEPTLQNGSLLIPTQPITTKYNVTILRQKRLLQSYQDLFLMDEQPNYVDFVCTNKYFTQWESNFCKTSIEIDTQSSLIIACDCQYFGPTTISSTLADIFEIDKFSKSFSLEAIEALNKFPFHRSVIFYCLVIFTILLILFLPYGIKKDQIDKERAMPQHMIESEYIRKLFEDRQKELQKEMEKIKEERNKEWKEFYEKQNLIEIVTDDKEQKQQSLDKDEQIQEVFISPDIDPDEMIDQQQQEQSDNSNNFNLDMSHDSDEEFQYEEYPPINISNKKNKMQAPSPYAKFFQLKNPYSLNNTIVNRLYLHSSSYEESLQNQQQHQNQKNLIHERHSSRIQSDQFSVRNSENIQQIILKKISTNQSKYYNNSLNSQAKLNDYPPLSPNSSSPIGAIYDSKQIIQPNQLGQSGSQYESHVNSNSTKVAKTQIPFRKSQEHILFLDHEFYEEDNLSIEEKEKIIQIWYLEKKRNKLLEEGFKLRFTLKNLFLFISLFQSVLSIIAIFDKKLPRPIRFCLIYMTLLTTCYINIFFQVELNPAATIAYSILSSILSMIELIILTILMPHQYILIRIIGWLSFLVLTGLFSYLIIASMAFEAQDSGGDVSRSNQWGINFIISFITMNFFTDPLQLMVCFKIIQWGFNNASPNLQQIFILLCMSKHFNIYFDFIDY